MGLKEAVKDRIAEHGRPSGLTELMQLAVRIDDRLYEKTLERKGLEATKGKQQNNLPSNLPDTSCLQTPEPMEWQASATNQGRRPQLTPEERTRRFENGLCFYCGSDKHKQFQCPDKLRDRTAARQPTRTLRAAATNPNGGVTLDRGNPPPMQTTTPSILAIPRAPSIATSSRQSTIELDFSENE